MPGSSYSAWGVVVQDNAEDLVACLTGKSDQVSVDLATQITATRIYIETDS